MAKNEIPIIISADDKASKVIGGISGKLKKGLAAGAAAGVVAAGVLAVAATKMAASFETGFAEVTTLFNASEEQVNKLRGDVLEMSRTMGVDAVDSTSALYQAISKGVPPDNAIEFLRENAKLAVGGVTDLTTAVELTTSVLNAWGLEAGELSRISDGLFKTVEKGGTTIGELNAAIGQVSPTAAGAGVSFESTAAALAVLTARGFSTAQASTGLNVALAELSKQGSIADKEFRNLANVGFKQFIAEGGTMVEGLQLMKAGADDMGKGVNDLFGGMEAGKAIMGLMNDEGVGLVSTFDEIQNAAGATDAAYEKMNKTFGRQMDILKSELKVLMIEFGSKILPLVTKAVQFLIEQLRKMRDWWAENKEEVKATMSEMWANVKPILDAIAQLFVVTFPFIRDIVIFHMNEVKAQIQRSLTIVMAIINLFKALFTGNWSELWKQAKIIVLTALQNMVAQVTKPLRMLWDVFNTQFRNIANTVVGWMENMVNAVIRGVNAAGQALNKGGFLGFLTEQAGDLGIPGADAANAFFSGQIGEVDFGSIGSSGGSEAGQAWWQAAADEIRAELPDAIDDTLDDIVDTGAPDFGSDFGDAAGGAAGGAMADAIVEEVESAFDILTKLFQEQASTMGKDFAAEFHAAGFGNEDFGSAVQRAMDQILSVPAEFRGEFDSVLGIIDEFANALESVDKIREQAVERGFVKIQDITALMAAGAFDAAQEFLDTFLGGTTDLSQEIFATMEEEAAKAAREAAEEASEEFNEVWEQGMDDLADAIDDAWSGITDAMNETTVEGAERRQAILRAELEIMELMVIAAEERAAIDAQILAAEEDIADLRRQAAEDQARIAAEILAIEEMILEVEQQIAEQLAIIDESMANRRDVIAGIESGIREMESTLRSMESAARTAAQILGVSVAGIAAPAENTLIAAARELKKAQDAMAATSADESDLTREEIRAIERKLAAAQSAFAAEEALALAAINAEKRRIAEQNALLLEQNALLEEEQVLRDALVSRGEFLVDWLNRMIASLENYVSPALEAIEALEEYIEALENTITPAEAAISELEDYIDALELIDDRQGIWNDLLLIHLQLQNDLLPTQADVNLAILDSIDRFLILEDIMGRITDGTADVTDALILMQEGLVGLALALLALLAELPETTGIGGASTAALRLGPNRSPGIGRTVIYADQVVIQGDGESMLAALGA